ncbi:MAG: hypothetical protein GY719_37390 [bacterium]|nr:hypothetical protein [bacterium]
MPTEEHKRERRTSNSSRQRRTSSHSFMVTDRKRAVSALVAALTAQGATAATALEGRLRDLLEEGETMPDVELLLQLLARLARKAERDLDEADAERWLAGMTCKQLRRESQQQRQELYAEAIVVRKALVELYGSAPCRRQFGLAERTPRGAAELATETRRLVDRLDSSTLRLPDPELPGLRPDPAGWVERLRPGLLCLERSLAELEHRRVTAQDEVQRRRRALEACDDTTLRVARAAEALFALAGEDELARRLRPKTRKRARIQVRAVAALRPRAWAASALVWLERLPRRLTGAAKAPERHERRQTADSSLARGGPPARIP